MILVNQHVILQIFPFLIDVFTPKRIYPDCPFKCIQRQVKISILTPQCAVCLFGDFFKYRALSGMYIAEIVSTVCIPPECLNNFNCLWNLGGNVAWTTLRETSEWF